MEKRTIIVTGASRGLGQATARQLARSAMNVVLNSRSEDRLQEVARQIDGVGGRTLVVGGDVSNPHDCRRLVHETVQHFGGLDAVINNAGVLEPIARIATADVTAWQNNIAVNLLAPFYLLQMALPHLRSRHGRVINVSSGAAVNATEGWSAYCTAKAGLNHFTRVLAAEEKEIVAVTFRPGVVDTEMQRTIREQGGSGMTAASHKRFVQYHEQGELLAPERPARSLAALALFAPREWSGDFVKWNEERVLKLVQQLE